MMMAEQQSTSAFRRARRGVALPVYALALTLDFLADGLGRLAAWIAGDQWP